MRVNGAGSHDFLIAAESVYSEVQPRPALGRDRLFRRGSCGELVLKKEGKKSPKPSIHNKTMLGEKRFKDELIGGLDVRVIIRCLQKR